MHPTNFKGGGVLKKLDPALKADPKSFGGGNKILNKVECELNTKTLNPKKAKKTF